MADHPAVDPLGLLIGWALWRRPWNKRYFSESEAITRVTREHSRTLTERDAEITRLRGLLDESGARAATAVDVASADTEDAPVQRSGPLSPTRSSPPRPPRSECRWRPRSRSTWTRCRRRP